MKIRDIYNIVALQSPVLGNPVFNTEWLDFYNDNYDILDRYFYLKWGNRVILADDMADFRLNAMSTLYTNKYKFDKLWVTLSLQYNPIYNVEEHTTETIKNDNVITDDKHNGPVETNYKTDYAPVVNRHDATYGDSNQNVTLGSHVDKVKNKADKKVAPFTDNSQHPTEWTNSDMTNNYGAQINRTENSSRHDVITNSTDDREDTAQSITMATDSDATRLEDLKQILQRDRTGNIGVMSTQNMIEQERRVALFNFWDTFFKEIVAECCMHILDDFKNIRVEGW